MKNGFTMAEVLITLGIIGIVAAMTLPSLINSKKNKELEASFKKNYSVIQQALDMYQAQNGERLSHGSVSRHELKPALMKYMKVLRDCYWGAESNADNIGKACIPANYSDSDSVSDAYKNFTGTTTMQLAFFDDGQFILNDGSLILLENSSGNLYISVDVNGYLKNPNRLGQDLFMFQIDNKGRLLPMGAEGSQYDSETYCSATSTNSLNGAGCTIKAINEKDYFSKL